jgi:hypothetical protein
MTEEETSPKIQEQQLVVLAMAEGFCKKADPEHPMNLNELVALWSNLMPRTTTDLAQHLMTAATVIGWLIFESADDWDAPVLDLVDHYRDIILSSPGGLLGDQADTNG